MTDEVRTTTAIEDEGLTLGIDDFIAMAEERLSKTNYGRFVQVTLEPGFYAWIRDNSKFFPAANASKPAMKRAFDEAKEYADGLGEPPKKVKNAFRLTQHAGSNIVPLPWDFDRDSTEVIICYQSATDGWEISFGWNHFLAKLRDSGFANWWNTPFWAQIRSTVHPRYNSDDPDPDYSDGEVYKEGWDSEARQRTGEYGPRFWTYIEYATNSREKLVARAAELGLEVIDGNSAEGVTTASTLKTNLPEGVTLPLDEWADAYDYFISRNAELKDSIKSPVKRFEAIAGEWDGTGITPELVKQVVEEAASPPF